MPWYIRFLCALFLLLWYQFRFDVMHWYLITGIAIRSDIVKLVCVLPQLNNRKRKRCVKFVRLCLNWMFRSAQFWSRHNIYLWCILDIKPYVTLTPLICLVILLSVTGIRIAHPTFMKLHQMIPIITNHRSGTADMTISSRCHGNLM